MTRSTLRSDEAGGYEHTSLIEVQSSCAPGVTYRIRRMSFGRRLELARRIRQLDQKLAYAQAGESLASKVDTAILEAEIERIYLAWGLEGIEGLLIDGSIADVDALADEGPEELTREILQAIRKECFLSEAERKN